MRATSTGMLTALSTLSQVLTRSRLSWISSGFDDTQWVQSGSVAGL